MAVNYTSARFSAEDDNGRPLVGGRLFTYQNGTTTPAVTYKDEAGTTPNTNPIILDSRGSAVVFVQEDQVYTFLLQNRFGSLLWSQNGVTGAITGTGFKAFLATLLTGAGASMVGFMQDAVGAVLRTVKSKLAENFSAFDFGAKANDDSFDNSPKIQSAVDFSSSDHFQRIFQPAGVYTLNSGVVLKFGSVIEGENTPRQALPGNFINADGEALRTNGTQWWTNAGSGSTSGQLVKMETGSRFANINLWYTGQQTAFQTDDPSDIVAYPPSILVGKDATGGNSDNVIVENVSALNCYEFMRIGNGVDSVGRTIVENVFANPLYKGITIQCMNGDLPMLRKVFIENIFSTGTGETPNLYAHIRTNAIAFDIGYAQGVNMTDCIALSYGYGLKVTDQSWAQVNNCLFDYCSVPFTATGADRVMISNSTFINNFKAGGPSGVVSGVINGLMFSNCVFGDLYSTIKTGLYCKHTSGTVKVDASTFRTAFPAVLNTGSGAVQIASCGIGYDRVVGKNISIDGGPALSTGPSLGLTNINPTLPAQTGWIYTTIGNVSSIPGGIRIAGVGNNTITYRAATISAAENNKLYFNTGLYVAEFDIKVLGQAGSPRLEILILDDANNLVGEAFQLCQDASTSDSGLPENETFHVSVIIPWTLFATQLRFNLPSQNGSVYEITNLDIKEMKVEKGFTGLEFMHGKTMMPTGYYDPSTGRKVCYFESVPPGGTGPWVAGDRTIKRTPTAGQPYEWVYTATGWVSKGSL